MHSDSIFPSEEMARNAARAWSLAKSIRIAMVSSINGTLRAPGLDQFAEGSFKMIEAAFGTRPMRARFQKNSNFIWFILQRSDVIGSEQREQPTLVTFSTGGEGDHVAFQGEASLCDDRTTLQSIWDTHAELRFPQGPSDESVILLRFVPHTAFYWTGGQDLISFMVRYVSAKLTGEAQIPGKRGGVAPL